MRTVGGSNNHRFIAVPFGCKLMVQIPRESSLCTDGSHGSRAMEGILNDKSNINQLCVRTIPPILYMFIFPKPKRRSFPQTGQLSPTNFCFVILTCISTSQKFQLKQHRKCISKTTPRKRLSSSLIPSPRQCEQEVVCLCKILQGFAAEQASSTRIFEDNQACIAMSENTLHARGKLVYANTMCGSSS